MTTTVAAPAPSASGPSTANRLIRWLRLIAVVMSGYVVLQDVETIANLAGVLPGVGTIGITATTETEPFSGVTQVISIAPGSPADRAGITEGDDVRADPPWAFLGYALAGDEIPVTVTHNGVERRVMLIAASDAHLDINQLRYGVATMISALFGIVVLMRSAGRLPALLLGLGLVAFGRPYIFPQPYEGAGWLFPFTNAIDYLLNAVNFPLFLGFAVSFDASVRGASLRWGWPLFRIMMLASIAIWALAWLTQTWQLPGSSVFWWLSFQTMVIPMIATVAVLINGRQGAPIAARRRYTLMLAALVPMFISQTTSNQLFSGLSPAEWTGSPLQIAADTLSGILTPALLAYAILHEKVIDLGFAINRTLVFSIVSAILLAAFGISEWAVEHVLKVEGREANALIDAGIALSLFLGFHRIQHSVRHFVESMFFREWHAAETALRLFVKRAGFITQADRLAADFAKAVERFAGGAQVAIYLRDGDGRLAKMVGDLAGAPQLLDPDLPAILALRAELQPIEDGAEEMAGILLVPMAVRHELGGVLLMAAKPSGEPYRPDQIELLGWAAEQIGLDLNALEIERLEKVSQRQRSEIAELNAAIDAIGRLTRAAV